MRHRTLAGPWPASPAAITSVPNDVAFDVLRNRLAPDHGQVTSLNRVLPKLRGEPVLGQRTETEDEQTAGLFVEPMDSPN